MACDFTLKTLIAPKMNLRTWKRCEHTIGYTSRECFSLTLGIFQVEKFELSKDEYAKRTNTVQHFLKINKLGKYNEEEMKRIDEEKLKAESQDAELAGNVKIGDRCEARVPGFMERRGTVKFVGKTDFKPGNRLRSTCQ